MKKIRKQLSIILVLTMMINGVIGIIQPFEVSAASWPSLSKSKYMKCYTISTGNNTTAYTSTSLRTPKGTIYASDELYIYKITDKYAYVSYPLTGGGRKEAYIPTSVITVNNETHESNKSSCQITTYRRPGSINYGYIAKNDNVIKVATSGNYTQVIYPAGNLYKMAWISTSSYNTYVAKISPSPSNSNSISNSNNNQYTGKLNDMMSGKTYSGTYKLNTEYRGPYYDEQCKGFAKSVHMRLFGYNIGSTNSKPNNHTISYSSSKTRLVGSVTNMTQTSIKSLFSNARPGDFVQMRRSHGGSHSAIVYAVSSSGVTFYEANLDNKNTIVKQTYSWGTLCSKNAKMSVYTAKSY